MLPTLQLILYFKPSHIKVVPTPLIFCKEEIVFNISEGRDRLHSIIKEYWN